MNIQVLGALMVVLAAQAPVAEEPRVTFGTTVFSSSGFRGNIYFIKPGSMRLPKFEKLKPVGSIYTHVLHVPPRDFREAKECDTRAFGLFFHRMRDAGVLLPPSQFEAWFLSAAHDDSVIDATLRAAAS